MNLLFTFVLFDTRYQIYIYKKTSNLCCICVHRHIYINYI